MIFKFEPLKVKATFWDKPTYVYIIRDSKFIFYIGITINLEKRLEQHRLGDKTSSQFTRRFSTFSLYQFWILPDRKKALVFESKLHLLCKYRDYISIALLKGQNLAKAKKFVNGVIKEYTYLEK